MKANLRDYTVKEVDGRLRTTPLTTEQPDFTIFTSAMTADAANPQIVNMVGSSTEQDLQDDIMDIQALQSMTVAQPGLAIWLNHDYYLPDSLFGSLAASPRIMQQNGVADLLLAVEVEPDSDDAMKTLAYIQRGKVRLGCSIGCKVLKYELITDGLDEDDPFAIFYAPMRILSVLPLEWSVVGIPANQRSWVENARRGIFARTLDPRLAPAVKSLFPRDYERIVASVDDRDVREQLAATPSYPLPTRRLSWQPKTKIFVLESPDAEDTPVASTMVPGVLRELKAERVAKQKSELAERQQALARVLSVKAACGKATWPLAQRDVVWDSSVSEQELEKWATDADDKLNPSKFASAHFWVDSANEDNVTAYKLAFCDVVTGEVKAVPKGIFACAAAVQGSHGNTPDIPSADMDDVKKKIEAYYERMAKEFDDPTIQVPWATSSGKTGVPAVQKDAPITAPAVETPPIETPAVEQPVGDAPIAAEQLNAELPVATSANASLLAAYNMLGKQLGFSEVNALGVSPEMSELRTQAAATFKTKDGIDITNMDIDNAVRFAHRLDDIADINAGLTDDLLHALGQPDSDDMADSAGSSSGTQPSGGMAYQQSGEAAVSMLRSMYAVRFKMGARHSADDKESIQAIHDACVALTDGLCCSATPSVNDPNESSNADDNPEADEGTMAASVPLVKELTLLRQAFDHINTHAVEADIAKAVEQLTTLTATLETRKAEIDAAVANARRAKEDALKAAEYSKEAVGTVKKLSEMPLGRPTGQIGRRVTADAGAVQFADMMQLAGHGVTAAESPAGEETLASALQSTTVEYVKGVGKCRRWPAGVGKGVRPTLTSEQKIIMQPNEMIAYIDGDEALVPEV